MRPPGTEHPSRAILAAHEVKHLDHLVSRSSYRVKLLLQLPKRVPAPSFSTGRVVTAPAGLRDPSGLHVHLYVWEKAALAVAR